MKTYKDRLEAKELDGQIIPCILDNKTLCKCVDPCTSRQILEFSLELNRLRNRAYCPSSNQGIQSTQAGPGIFDYCPLVPKWKTVYQQETGKKLRISPRQASALYDFLNSKKSKFGIILREVIGQQAAKNFAQHHVSHPSCEQGITSSQRGDYFSCIKVEHPYKRKVKAKCHDNCCQTARKNCCSKGGSCKKTSCF